MVTVENKKKEDKLYQRVANLEEENKQLLKAVLNLTVKQDNTDQRLEFYRDRVNELSYSRNLVVTHINSIIMELNNVITILNNKDEENRHGSHI